jgi:mRNA interferase YafQ
MTEEVFATQEGSRFRRDLKRMFKRGKDIGKLKGIIVMLANEITLPIKYRDHSLTGNWFGYRECHVEPDWLLIYRILTEEKQIYLARTGTHSDLFSE